MKHPNHGSSLEEVLNEFGILEDATKVAEERVKKFIITEMVRDNQKATFQYFKDGDFWYKTETGFEFPIPASDVGTATFNAEEKALLLMRWIRKHIKVIENKD